MRVRWPLLVLWGAFLAGCTAPAAPDAPSGTPSACLNALQGVCFDGLDAELRFEDCVTTAAGFELDAVVYELPEGFETRRVESAQRIILRAERCAQVSAGDLVESDVTVGSSTVLVETPAWAPTDGASLYALEILTDSSIAATAYRAAGFNVLTATVTLKQDPTHRVSRVEGDVAYTVESDFVPYGDSPFLGAPPIPHQLAVHSASAWALHEDTCQNYFATANHRLIADRGELARAMEHLNPLPHTSSLYFACSTAVGFQARMDG